MHTRRSLAFCATALLALLAPSSHAKSVQFRFVGAVANNSTTRAPWNAVQAGQTATSTYTFDSLTPGAQVSESARAYANAITAVTATIGAVSASGPVSSGSTIFVSDNTGGDQYTVETVPLPGNFELLVILLAPGSTTGPLINQQLPFFIELARWTSLKQGYISDTTGPGNVRINWTSFELVSVQCQGDADGNTVVNFADIIEVLRNFAGGCP